MIMKTDILAVNPGSTSTKVGVFRCQEDGKLTELFMETINHCCSMSRWRHSSLTAVK